MKQNNKIFDEMNIDYSKDSICDEYIAPCSYIVLLESEGMLCTSGDFDNEDYEWGGSIE